MINLKFITIIIIIITIIIILQQRFSPVYLLGIAAIVSATPHSSEKQHFPAVTGGLFR